MDLKAERQEAIWLVRNDYESNSLGVQFKTSIYPLAQLTRGH